MRTFVCLCLVRREGGRAGTRNAGAWWGGREGGRAGGGAWALSLYGEPLAGGGADTAVRRGLAHSGGRGAEQGHGELSDRSRKDKSKERRRRYRWTERQTEITALRWPATGGGSVNGASRPEPSVGCCSGHGADAARGAVRPAGRTDAGREDECGPGRLKRCLRPHPAAGGAP